MLPIGDEERAWRTTPFVTWALVVVLALVYGYQSRLPPLAERQLILDLALVPARLADDFGRAWPTLATHLFLHGSVAHVAGNALFLVVFGRRVESELGRLPFLGFFLAGGVLAGLASTAARWGSDVPGLGASGAISAIMGAYLVLFPAAQIRILVLHPFTLLWVFLNQSLLTFGVPALVVILAWFGLQVVEGLTSLASPGGVDYAAHVGGFLAGFAAIQVLRRLFGLWPDELEEPPDLPLAAACVGAARPLAPGRPLAPADLQVQARRPGGLDDGAVPATKLEAIVGRRLRTARFRYEAIRWEDLEAARETAAPTADGSATGR